MLDPSYGAYWRLASAGFTAAIGTQAKIVVDETPAIVLPAVAGETALPGEASVRQRILQGGCRVIDGNIASTDGAARSVLIYLGRVLSKPTSYNVTGQNSLNSFTGSFITDGWKIGDAVMPFDSETAANNGVLGIVTSVAASSLVVNGTPYANQAPQSPVRLVRVVQRTRRGIPANSGNTDSAPAVALMGGTQDPATPALPDTGYSLGDLDVLIAAMVAAVSALPARIDVHAIAARY